MTPRDPPTRAFPDVVLVVLKRVVAVSDVAEADERVVCPVAESVEVKRLVALTPVVEALMRLAIVA